MVVVMVVEGRVGWGLLGFKYIYSLSLSLFVVYPITLVASVPSPILIIY